MGMMKTIALASAVLVSGWVPASAQTTWNFANAYAATEFQSQGYDMFAQKVAEGSNGELEVTVHHGGSLFPNPEILQATRDGLVEMGTQLMTNLGRENALWDLDGLPFFVGGYDDGSCGASPGRATRNCSPNPACAFSSPRPGRRRVSSPSARSSPWATCRA